jgi:hypothetical protein
MANLHHIERAITWRFRCIVCDQPARRVAGCCDFQTTCEPCEVAEAEEHACAECGQPNDRRRAVAHPELCGPCYVLGAPALRYE